jgi:hypothetical protein
MKSSGGLQSPSEDSAEALREFQGYLNSDEEVDFLRSGEKGQGRAGSTGDEAVPGKAPTLPVQLAGIRAWSKVNLELIQEEDSLQTETNQDDTLYNSTTNPNRTSMMIEKDGYCTTGKDTFRTSQRTSMLKKDKGVEESPPKKTVPRHPISEFFCNIQIDLGPGTSHIPKKSAQNSSKKTKNNLKHASSNDHLFCNQRHKSESVPVDHPVVPVSVRKVSSGLRPNPSSRILRKDSESVLDFPKIKRKSASKDSLPTSVTLNFLGHKDTPTHLFHP